MHPYTETHNHLSPITRSRLQGIIDPHLGETFPTLALAVIHQGKITLEAAWGWTDPETQQYPVTPESRFDLASVTKLFVATTFLGLVSAGQVRLEDALVSIIPEFAAANPRPVDGGQDPHTREMLPAPAARRGLTVNPAQVTFRHLLTHTSGLAPWRAVFDAAGPLPLPPDQPDPLDRATRWANGLKAIYSYPFIATPGTEIHYSDLGLILLGEAVARLHGASGDLASAVQARVLNPLRLTSATYNPLRNGCERGAIPPTEFDTLWRKRRCWGEVHDENACGLGGVAGHAGLFARARDVAALGQAWLIRDARLHITPDVMDAATRTQAEDDSVRRGLGWMLRSHTDSSAGDVFDLTAYGHTGFTGTSLWIDPTRELVVACLTNRVYPGREKPGIHAFRRAVHDCLAEEII
jgi:CubicO group peptidase (beta-lactamase class C family)